MSQVDASIILGAFWSCVPPLAHAWMKSNILPDWVKFVVAVLLSILGGTLTIIVSGKLINTLSIIQTAALIGSASAGIYAILFRQFGLESVLYPRAGVITEAQKSVAAQIGMMSTQTIKDAANPESSTVISVQATPVQYMGAEQSSVQPRG